jgi:hypothetical protein
MWARADKRFSRDPHYDDLRPLEAGLVMGARAEEVLVQGLGSIKASSG